MNFALLRKQTKKNLQKFYYYLTVNMYPISCSVSVQVRQNRDYSVGSSNFTNCRITLGFFLVTVETKDFLQTSLQLAIPISNT